ncbi:type II secretion system protein [Coraliomargarita sp. SDUM461004]|uniref:Type II secretion system protein n=1 Tax=Thalassobacterium sedimentorum TaxID=3041258 RepID=A0ABU1AHW0_9BACT|nr:type II secretion system protein [Coraliomargarita sp. SDUM461004]MDQ8193371.1 type II secretion system protein [Coraliomargarita sp. SDUM461004]
MTLETGQASSHFLRSRASNRPRAHAGFTLLEIILVFALISLAAGVIIANFTTFLNFDDRIDPEETLRAAIRSARFQAASERQITSLSFDKESGALRLNDSTNFPLSDDFKNGASEIRFYLVAPARGMGPFPKAERSQLETKRVHFAPDRSSSPFVAEIDTGTGSPERIIFDPFSSLVKGPQ